MNRDAIARERRRRQAQEQLEFEREREVALRDQLEEIVAEQLGSAVDDAAFAHMSPEDVEVVRAAISGGEDEEPFEDEWLAEGVEDDPAEAAEASEAEILRLQGELAGSHRRQAAFEAYIAALDAVVPATRDA